MIERSESINELTKALVKVQGEMPVVVKDAVNPHFRSRYASLEAVMGAVKGLLAANGCVVMQGGGIDRSFERLFVTVETVIVHTSGEWVKNTVSMPIAKADPQGVGSGISYGRRYGLSPLLGIVDTDEDDDGNAASHAPSVKGVGSKGVEPKRTTPVEVEKVPEPKRTPFDEKVAEIGQLARAVNAVIDEKSLEREKFGSRSILELIAAVNGRESAPADIGKYTLRELTVAAKHFQGLLSELEGTEVWDVRVVGSEAETLKESGK